MKRFSVGLLVALAACGDSDASPDSDAGITDGDGGRRVKPRTVRIGLGRAAERELIEGPDGELVLGKLTQLPDASRCLTHVREAWSHLQPFDVMEPPLCADENGRIEDVPIHSEFVVTFESPGLLPTTQTLRTDAFDLDPPGWVLFWSTVLIDEDAVAPWVEPPGAIEPGEGLATIYVAMIYRGPETGVAGVEQLGSSGTVEGVALGEGTVITIEPAGGASSIEVRARRDRPLFVRVPVGPARIHFDHPGVNCRPVATINDYEFSGLSVDVQGAIEVPILEGHAAFAVIDCFCIAGPDDGPLVDLATCEFGPAAPDAGAP